MKKYGKNALCLGSSFEVAFVIWTALILFVDVQAIGQNGTNIGLATCNSWFHQCIGVHMAVYIITDWLGVVPILICMIFCGMGLSQLMKRRSFFMVDYDIIFLGIYYIVVMLVYLIFEMIPINYRPILIEGRLEASYPSSTTLLVLCVMPTFCEQIKRRMDNVLLRRVLCTLVSCFSIFMVLGRLFSGVHWFTDIVGGMLFSTGLFNLYKAAVFLRSREENI